MENLNKKQKIILGIIIVILISVIFYYVYVVRENNIETISNINEIIPYDGDSENYIESVNTDDNQITEKFYSDETIIIHIAGAVNKEGVYELKINSRVADAIDKAGGLREDAYIDKINLAYILEDGMKIYIPNTSEKDMEKTISNDSTGDYITDGNSTNTKSSSNSSNSKTNTQKVNINIATQTELETLPGIGPSTALKIINYREENGKFGNIEDVKNVSGIGESKYSQIKDLICI